MAFISTPILIPGDLAILILGLYVRLPSYIFQVIVAFTVYEFEKILMYLTSSEGGVT